MIEKCRIFIMGRIHMGSVMQLLQKCETFIIDWFQCRGIVLFFKNCIAFIKRQFKLLLHHIKCLDLFKFIFKHIKHIQISTFLMMHHVMRILQAIYHMTIWNIGGRTSILQPFWKFPILSFELMNILIIIQVFFM